jgi:hypothetical protein
MKAPSIENVIVDEVHQRTYVVMARRILTDGEVYKAIRVELLRRGESLAKGERLVITVADAL